MNPIKLFHQLETVPKYARHTYVQPKLPELIITAADLKVAVESLAKPDTAINPEAIMQLAMVKARERQLMLALHRAELAKADLAMSAAVHKQWYNFYGYDFDGYGEVTYTRPKWAAKPSEGDKTIAVTVGRRQRSASSSSNRPRRRDRAAV